jgi:flagellar hook-basal body complex protein FliE
MSAGKGDKPRNCFSKQFKTNFDQIDWKQKKKSEVQEKTFKGKKIYVYKQT